MRAIDLKELRAINDISEELIEKDEVGYSGSYYLIMFILEGTPRVKDASPR